MVQQVFSKLTISTPAIIPAKIAISEYLGDVHDMDAQVWLDCFDHFCLDHGIEADSIHKAQYFKTFMLGAAKIGMTP